MLVEGTEFSHLPPSPRPVTMQGYVIQALYNDKQTETGRLTPFDPNDDSYDLQFRDWRVNGFATRAPQASEIHASQLAFGWRSRILPGVAEQVGAAWLLHTLH